MSLLGILTQPFEIEAEKPTLMGLAVLTAPYLMIGPQLAATPEPVAIKTLVEEALGAQPFSAVQTHLAAEAVVVGSVEALQDSELQAKILANEALADRVRRALQNREPARPCWERK